MSSALSRTQLHPSTVIYACADLLEKVRSTTPLVQCVTNSVVTNMTANALLAVGATPAMVDIPIEAAQFTAAADGLLINLGTPHEEQRAAIVEAATAAAAHDTPWVLDPVAVGVLSVRTALARQLLNNRPTAIRGNPSEIIALAGAGSGGRGTDSAHGVDEATHAAHTLCDATGAIIAVSGPRDLITDGGTDLLLANGTPLLTKITGGGCALGAMTAAFLAVGRATPLHATAAATLVYTVAAQRAATRASGPGSFQVAFMDELADIAPETIAAQAVIV